jgi:DNA-binding NtrC family response regulator
MALPTRILIVDDDRYTRGLLQELLQARPAELDLARDAAEARRRFAAGDYNLVLMDQRLPDGNGLDLLREMRGRHPRLVAILMTGYADVRDAMASVREGLFDYLTKPFEDLEALERVIDKALELDRAYREITSLRASLAAGGSEPVLIGRSPAMQRLLGQIQQVAHLDATVVLEGESGTGKDLVAKALHMQSPRAQGRFIDVNCGALPENLLESLLFGHEKGAFTGAVQAKAGYFETVDGGTIFLDEIADMSPKLQSSLLRVLQDGSFTRIGSNQPRSSDFRLVCATNRPLAAEVEAGRFRDDLYYRINVIALRMPPLRERAGDIVRLATHFLDHFSAKFGKQVGPLSPAAFRILESSGWPGNVRQLKHAMERLVALHPGGPVDATQLKGSLDDTVTTAEPPSPSAGVLPYEEARAAFEQEYMTRLLEVAGGNVSEAARLSSIPRQNLYVRMRRWGIVTK